tara:strand:- start:2797 stop:4770 length:1974 start_codon:yes stop_codon:yes gene_type:complete
MRKVLALFLFTLVAFSCATIGQQTFNSHRVAQGETVYGIAKKYNLTEYEIYKLNPEAKEGIYPGLVLILPSGHAIVNEDTSYDENNQFINHKVKKGETLFSLSKKYGVAQEEIKKYNRHLYAEELETGETIKIPQTSTEITETTSKPMETQRKHVVKAKETKFGLASMYGITIAELEELNPQIKEGLQIGMILSVPDKSYTQDATIDDAEYGFYEVKPKETMYSLTRSLEVSPDELMQLNPSLKDGLKAGMVLKLPKKILEEKGVLASQESNLANELNNFSVKNVALMLPFNLKQTEIDSADIRKNVLKSDRLTRISLDFYSGALMAVDSAKAQGISSNLYIYDTEYSRTAGDATNGRKIENIIRSNNFQKMDVVVGPLMGSNVDRAAAELRGNNVPVISPLSDNVRQSANIFKSRPADETMRKTMLHYIERAGAGKNIIIVADSKNYQTRDKIKSLFPSAHVVTPRGDGGDNFIYANDVNGKLEDGRENWIILETDKIPLISSVITYLNTQRDKKNITLMTTLKGNVYDSDDISNMVLMNLNFHFPSISNEGLTAKSESFAKRYKSRYGVTPSTYATRAFDVTYDVLLRLAAAENLYAVDLEGKVSEYVENKFNYVPETFGYANDAVYIMRYGKDLTLEAVPMPVEDPSAIQTIKN